MTTAALLLSLIGQCVFMAVAAQRPVCFNETRTVNSTVSEADFLFLLDASASMEEEIDGIAGGFNALALFASQFNVSARFGVVRFGGFPSLFLPFVSDLNDLSAAVAAVRGSINSGPQESSLEAVRGSLPPENGTLFTKRCASKYASTCMLNWRPDALKVIVVATDEDSDLPHITRYRAVNQTVSSAFCSGTQLSPNSCSNSNRYEPSYLPSQAVGKWSSTKNRTEWTMYRTWSTLSLTEGFEAEIKLTADALLRNRAFANFIVSPNGAGRFSSGNPFWTALPTANRTRERNSVVTSTYQYGDPGLQVQYPNFTNFNPAATLNFLRSYKLQNSLQARLLEAGGFMRLYPISSFALGVNPGLVSAFFNQVIRTTQSIVQHCSYPDAPVASELFVPTESSEDFEPDDQNVPITDEGVPPVVIVSNSQPAEETRNSDEEIKDSLQDFANKLVEEYNNITKSETNVALILTALSASFAGAVIAGVIAHRNKERIFEFFKGSLLDRDAGVATNPLYHGNETKENPLYNTGEANGATATTEVKVI